jgi:hypothetical protein
MARILENKTARNIKLNINQSAYEARHLAKPQNVTSYFMKNLLLIISFLLSFSSLKASPQAPDILVIEKDTLSIYFLPLNSLDSITMKKLSDNILKTKKQIGFSTNLWRGFQAIWRLENEKLYLIGIKGIQNSGEILSYTFREKYQNSKVLADWFSSYLVTSKDKILRWDGIFSRTYFKEKIFQFENGNLVSQREIENYLKVKNGIPRIERDNKAMAAQIFKKIKKLDWKKMSDCGCDDEYKVMIDDIGKVSKVEFIPLEETEEENIDFANQHSYCLKTFLEKLKPLQFDIIKWHGEPYFEVVHLKLFYDEKLENWSE